MQPPGCMLDRPGLTCNHRVACESPGPRESVGGELDAEVAEAGRGLRTNAAVRCVASGLMPAVGSSRTEARYDRPRLARYSIGPRDSAPGPSPSRQEPAMTASLVTYAVDGKLGIVTLNRPDKLNA